MDGFEQFYKQFERVAILICQASPGNKKIANKSPGDLFHPAIEPGTYDYETFASIYMVFMKAVMDSPDYHCRKTPTKKDKCTSPNKVVSMIR